MTPGAGVEPAQSLVHLFVPPADFALVQSGEITSAPAKVSFTGLAQIARLFHSHNP